ncbi:hypothetical protein BTVI_36156 [Pitangus sulphuratus]|nr:hypothetical protein BTVI_36156 [Pitangus sulphuratus]
MNATGPGCWHCEATPLLRGHGNCERCEDEGKASVTPGFERGRKEDSGNYRPWGGDGPTIPGNHFQAKKEAAVSMDLQRELAHLRQIPSVFETGILEFQNYQNY